MPSGTKENVWVRTELLAVYRTFWEVSNGKYIFHLLLNIEVFHGRLEASPLGGSSALIVGVVVLTGL
jgi:hypothetical protein